MEGSVKALRLAALYLVLAAGGASASDGTLPAGKPAGVHRAALNASTTEIAVGAAVAAAIAVILASTSSGSSPATAG
jgi:hypothetical protein